MVISAIDRSHFATVGGPVSIVSLPVELSCSRCLLRGGLGFCSRLLCFRLHPSLLFLCHNLFSIFHVPLMFPLLHDFRITVRLDETGSCQGGSSMSIVLAANHSPQSREGAGGWNLVPMWGPPLMFLLSIKPLT